MSEWRETAWGDMISLQRGYDITKSEQVLSGQVPVVSSGGISSFHDTAMSQGPGVLVGRKGTLGRVYFVEGPFWPHDTTLWVRDFKGNLPRFVYYALKGIDARLLNVGSASPTLNRNDVHPLPVSWPESYGEQRTIADLLGALDDKIISNAKLIGTSEELAVGIASESVPTVTLSEIVSHHKRSVDPTSLDDALVEHFSLPAFDAQHAPEVVAPQAVKSAKLEICQPSVLASKLNPRFPRIWDVPALGTRRGLASTEFLVLDSRFSSSSVLWSVLSQPSFSTSLESQVAGTSGSHQRVRPADLLATQVIDPRTMPDQAKDAITSLGLCAAAYRSESAKLATMRDTLLPELMTGRIRVKDADRVVGKVI